MTACHYRHGADRLLHRAGRPPGWRHNHVAGCDADPDVAPEVAKLQLVDSFTDDAIAAVGDADLVIVAVPVGVVGALAAKIIPAMKDGAVLTDTDSTKRSVIRDVTPHLQPHVYWLPSHPLAGTEHSGRQRIRRPFQRALLACYRRRSRA